MIALHELHGSPRGAAPDRSRTATDGRPPARRRPARSGTLELAAQEPAGDDASLTGLPFDANAFESRLVWIMGAPRTGSTWLLRLLIHPWILARGTPSGLRARCPGVGASFRTWCPSTRATCSTTWRPCGRCRVSPPSSRRPTPSSSTATGAPTPPTSSAMRSRAPGSPSSGGSCSLGSTRSLSALPASTASPILWCSSRSPTARTQPSLRWSLLPRSRLLFLLRDGRDVIDSLLDARGAEAWIGAGNMDMSDATERLAYVRLQARLWLNSTNAVQSAYAAHPEELRRTSATRTCGRTPRDPAAACRLARPALGRRRAAGCSRGERLRSDPRRIRCWAPRGAPRRLACGEKHDAAEQQAMEQSSAEARGAGVRANGQ